MKKIQKTKNCEKNQENKIFVVNIFFEKTNTAYTSGLVKSPPTPQSRTLFSHILPREFFPTRRLRHIK